MLLFSVWRCQRGLTSAFTARTLQKRVFSSLLYSSKEDWTTDKVRSTFIEYFEKQDHTFQPSSACAPLNDPTLLFTNAGMNQFKPIFLGQADPNTPLGQLQRACNAQKCIRAGGKHNDLEDVGRDTYHHTFFEMLGSWSFGDYFKKEAIEYAWDLLVNVYKLDPDRLYATYFGGDDSVPADEQARDFWLEHLPPERVLACGAADNFWEMGETGPCGPCSEIHYDRIGGRDAAALVNADDPDVIEIWNIVFIQFNRESATKLQTLPAQHVDTGMGLERLVSILQNHNSNYDIDAFQAIFKKLETMTDKGPYTSRVGEDDTDLKDTAYRVLADHARTLTFAIADGAIPNNEGRGYVLRRILRRATRYGQQILNCEPGFFAKLVPTVVETFGGAYPELVKQQDAVLAVIEEEESAFSSMLNRGIKFFDEELKGKNDLVVPGDKAFYLYDTLGFPIDLTELMADEAGMTVDTEGFVSAMNEQKERSRQAQRAARGDGAVNLEFIAEQTAWLTQSGITPTDDAAKYVWNDDVPASIQAVYGQDGFFEADTEIPMGSSVGIVLDKSSFYAESGGQVADTGVLELQDESGKTSGSFKVTDVQVYAGFLLHKGVVESGSFKVGAAVECKVNYKRRELIAPNHSMTHILNAALRKTLGDSVEQRGTLYNEEKLRFDFSHPKAMKAKQLVAVEQYCQEAIANEEAVTSKVMPLEEAKQIEGVQAVFGEVYPDPVRVVQIGSEAVEFCGGTHIENTREAEAFVLVEETAVAKGIRRVAAITKDAAKQAIQEGEDFTKQVEKAEAMDPASTPDLSQQAASIRKDLDAAFVSAALKAELRARIEDVQKIASDYKKKELQKRIDLLLNDVKAQVDEAIESGKRSIVVDVDILADSKSSQKVLNSVKAHAPDIAFMGLSRGDEGNVLAFSIVPESMVEAGLAADAWVRASLESCGGKGGGKPGNAQGQAKECEDFDEVLRSAVEFAGQYDTSLSPS